MTTIVDQPNDTTIIIKRIIITRNVRNKTKENSIQNTVTLMVQHTIQAANVELRNQVIRKKQHSKICLVVVQNSANHVTETTERKEI